MIAGSGGEIPGEAKGAGCTRGGPGETSRLAQGTFGATPSFPRSCPLRKRRSYGFQGYRCSAPSGKVYKPWPHSHRSNFPARIQSRTRFRVRVGRFQPGIGCKSWSPRIRRNTQAGIACRRCLPRWLQSFPARTKYIPHCLGFARSCRSHRDRNRGCRFRRQNTQQDKTCKTWPHSHRSNFRGRIQSRTRFRVRVGRFQPGIGCKSWSPRIRQNTQAGIGCRRCLPRWRQSFPARTRNIRCYPSFPRSCPLRKRRSHGFQGYRCNVLPGKVYKTWLHSHRSNFRVRIQSRTRFRVRVGRFQPGIVRKSWSLRIREIPRLAKGAGGTCSVGAKLPGSHKVHSALPRFCVKLPISQGSQSWLPVPAAKYPAGQNVQAVAPFTSE